jgi:phytoene synthase
VQLIETRNSVTSSDVLRHGSKTFALATLFFPRDIQESVYDLYAWCRKCDDITDGSLLGMNQTPKDLAPNRVELLKKWTDLALDSGAATDSLAITTLEFLGPEFLGLRKVFQKYQIPAVYAQDLLSGLSQDVCGESFQTLDHLILYCYRVAGTVGLMMCHIMGIKDPGALGDAVQLGIALQLTNIVRDIADDFRVGRVYMPRDWLNQQKIPISALMDPQYAQERLRLMENLVQEADRRYAVGMAGLVDLSWRSALAVAIAASLYRAIGKSVLKMGVDAGMQRCVLSPIQKVAAVVRGLFFCLKTLPQRILHPRKKIEIQVIWRYS